MKAIKRCLFVLTIIFSIACGFFFGQKNSVPVTAQKTTGLPIKMPDFFSKIKTERIREIKVWNDGETDFYAVIRQTDQSPSKDSTLKTSDELTIYNESGKALYQYRDFGLENVKTVRFLKSDSPQIMFENNGGGTDNFLKILDYKDGKFREMIDESETQMRGGFWTMPQYRTGNKTAYFNPSQLIVIQQIGGAEENPSAAVFRFQNNKFQNVGSFSMRDLGDLIEKQIASK